MIERIFIPGSKWLYYKIYTGALNADIVLIKYLSSFLNNALQSKVISNYFFIRYNDPDLHIRIRFQLSSNNHFNTMINGIYECLNQCLQEELIQKIICDTYVREIERYGEQNIELSEYAFGIDSSSIISLLSTIYNKKEKNNLRWYLAFRLIDDSLEAFGFDLNNKHLFAKHNAKLYKNEFGFTNGRINKQLNYKFRHLRSTIIDIFDKSMYLNEDINSILDFRKERLIHLYSEMCNNISNDFENSELHKLVGSHIHMTINRLFPSKQRLNEMVIYEFLSRHYDYVVSTKHINK